MEQEPPRQVITATCGNCAMFRRVETSGASLVIGAPKMGQCYMLPPTPVAVFANDMRSVKSQVNLRPVVRENEGCGMFALSPELVDAANDAAAPA